MTRMNRIPEFQGRWLLYLAGPVITALWLVSMGLVVKKELLPRIWLPSATSGYKSILSSLPVYRDEWMGLYFQDIKVGYTHLSIYPYKKEEEQGYLMTNQTNLILSLLGKKTKVRTRGHVFIGADFQLKDFKFSLNADQYQIQFTGHLSDRTLWVEIDSGSTKSTRSIPVKKDIILAHSLTPFLLMGKLEPGDRHTVNLFDPLSLSIRPAVIEVAEKEILKFDGKEMETIVVNTSYQGLEVKAWVSPEGEVLRQETSMGWVMVKETQDQVLPLGREPGLDILEAVSVPASIVLESPRELKYLKVKIKGIEPVDVGTSGPRQRWLNPDEGILEITCEVIDKNKIYSLPLDKSFVLSPFQSLSDTEEVDDIKEPDRNAENLREYLRATSFIQSDDERIIQQAKRIIQDEKNAWAAACKISDWVYKSVKKVPTFSVPSSIDVLNTKEGDCNEHTYLFTALARSVGIPTSVCVGLVYFEKRFYYHAWPRVYVGQWVNMDPTLNQHICDATHIRLLEGELADQARLVGMIGKIKIDILDYH